MKFFVYLSVLIVFFVFTQTGIAGESRKAVTHVGLSSDARTEPLRITTADGRDYIFNIEVVSQPADLMRGLMFRTELPDDGGMLFDFGNVAERRFWMKNTLIPLDMVFIKPDGLIHHIHANAIPEDLTGIPSNGPVSHVLEVKGGTAAKLGIKPGDRVLSAQYFKQ